jgi:hypothetical protein
LWSLAVVVEGDIIVEPEQVPVVLELVQDYQ